MEWSTDRKFESFVDFEIFQDLMNPEQLVVEGLTAGLSYFVRVSVANLAGFGMPVLAQPSPIGITCRLTNSILLEIAHKRFQ